MPERAAAEAFRGTRITTVHLTLGMWFFCLLTFTASLLVAYGGVLPRWLPVWLGLITTTGMLGSLAVWAAVKRLERSRSMSTRWAILAVVATAVAMLQSLIDTRLGNLAPAMFGGHVSTFRLEAFALNCLIYVWLFGFYAAALELFSMHEKASIHARRSADYARQLAEARELARDAQLQMLRFQLNPHFLFNTLNNISSLVVSGEGRRAELMIAGLCRFLRASLTPAQDELIALRHELTLIEAYLDVEGVRFPYALDVEIDCPNSLESALVPSLILQPLVENAVKYALTPSLGRSSLRIVAREQDEALVVSIIDGGANGATPVGAVVGPGIGLQNVARRIEVIYGASGRLEVHRLGEGFSARLHIPLRRGDLEAAA
ncbi:hypothetical protein DDF62_08875 [Caulobacter radicis]|nr:hypothetical protein DDF62_08875 [Caulobacter radicis]